MPRNSNTPERDDRGRFIGDDDRGGSRGRSFGRYDDDDRRYSRSRRDDDDSDRGQGWYGDSRGHSEASRLGWERRGAYDDRDGRSSRGSDRERDEYGRFVSDDDYHRSSRGGSSRGSGNDRERDEYGRFMSDDDDRRSSSRGNGGRGRSSDNDRGRDEYGRFMSDDDDRRSSSSHGRGDDRGQGWFGDREGHAEAARRGWERRDDDDHRSYSSSRSSGGRGSNDRERDAYGRFMSDDDDDRRSSSRGRGDDRGQGGWFGDREGHAEAARRGWENRDDDDRRGSRFSRR